MRNTLRLPNSRMKKIAVAVMTAGLMAAVAGPAAASSSKVRFAQQFGLLYLPMHVVVSQKLVESCARSEGIDDIKVSMHSATDYDPRHTRSMHRTTIQGVRPV